MKHYGTGNDQRMTGEHETSDYNIFSYGVANRKCSVRIPRETEKLGKGYLEDRRPGSNMDPYQAFTSIIGVLQQVPVAAIRGGDEAEVEHEVESGT
mgnify:CR=1 FL=1